MAINKEKLKHLLNRGLDDSEYQMLLADHNVAKRHPLLRQAESILDGIAFTNMERAVLDAQYPFGELTSYERIGNGAFERYEPNTVGKTRTYLSRARARLKNSVASPTGPARELLTPFSTTLTGVGVTTDLSPTEFVLVHLLHRAKNRTLDGDDLARTMIGRSRQFKDLDRKIITINVVRANLLLPLTLRIESMGHRYKLAVRD